MIIILILQDEGEKFNLFGLDLPPEGQDILLYP